MKLTIYVTEGLYRELSLLPNGSISGICQEALRKAIADAKAQREQQVIEILEED